MKKLFFTFFIIATTFTVPAQINVGDKLPAIQLKSSHNTDVNLSSFQGKYILLDFWASWCGPCRVGNKKLVKLHNEISPDTIEIIGISIDTDANKWLKAIEKDKIKFTQLIDPKGFDSNTAVQFGVEELPSKFLFSPDGILIAINPTEEELTELIKK